MSLYLPVRAKGSAAVTVCPRCQFKYHMDAMVQDPNNKLWVCKGCQDIFDPWRLPARQTENISLPHPRPDTDIATDGTTVE